MTELADFLAAINAPVRRARRVGMLDRLTLAITGAMVFHMAVELLVAWQAGRL